MQQPGGLVANGRDYGGIEPAQPTGGNALHSVEGAGQLAGQRAGGVGITAAIDDAHETRFKIPGAEEGVEQVGDPASRRR